MEHDRICAHRISRGRSACDMECADPKALRLAKRCELLEQSLARAVGERDEARAVVRWMKERDRQRST